MTEQYVKSKRLNKIMVMLAEDLDERTELYRQEDGSYVPQVSGLLSPEQQFVTIQLAGFAKVILDLGMSLGIPEGDSLAGAVAPILTRISHVEFGDRSNTSKVAELVALSQSLEEAYRNIGLQFPKKYWQELGIEA